MIFPELDSKSDSLEAIGIASNHPHRVMQFSCQLANLNQMSPDESTTFSLYPTVRIPMILVDSGYPAEYAGRLILKTAECWPLAWPNWFDTRPNTDLYWERIQRRCTEFSAIARIIARRRDAMPP